MTPKKPVLKINEFAQRVHQTARDHGWWDGPPPNIPEKLCLIHSEVTEALEEYRKGKALALYYREDGKPEGMPVELADTLIRIFDLAAYLEIDLEYYLKLKADFNDTRPHRHGGKEC